METYRNLSGIINEILGSSSYGSIAMPSGVNCKAMIVKTRTAVAFTLATGSAGETYASIGASDVLSMDLAKNSGELIFWAKAETGTPVLEVMLFNY